MDDNEFDNDHEDNDDVDADQAGQETPKKLRRAAKEGTKAKAEAAALKRELAMVKAGVDTESPIGKLFARAYDGDVTPEAVKAEWAKINGAPVETPA